MSSTAPSPSPAETACGWELPEILHRCHACGKFCSDDDFWGDHGSRGCWHRQNDPESGTDECCCYLEAFCSESCADRWHEGGAR